VRGFGSAGLFLPLLVLLLAASAGVPASDPAQQQCDALAASPSDLSRPAGVPGVQLEKIDALRAQDACLRAVQEQPSPRLFYQLARAFQAGRKEVEALTNYRIAADRGYVLAQGSLGWMYQNGVGVTKNDAQAALWYRKAADQGDMVSQDNLGGMYENGQGVAKDGVQAALWYRKAADQGYARAQSDLGWMYQNGQGVAKDDVQAVLWYRKAADQGYAPAQTNLGWMYQEGRGVVRDDAQAAAWYRKAGDQGFAGAQLYLGLMYLAGRGVKHDDAIGAAWMLKAAEQGVATAQYNVGFLHDNGRGLPHDNDQALAWYNKAAANGSTDATSALKAKKDSDNTALGALVILGLGLWALTPDAHDEKDQRHAFPKKSEYERELERIESERRARCYNALLFRDPTAHSIPGCY